MAVALPKRVLLDPAARSASARKSRNKGKTFEREVRDAIILALPRLAVDMTIRRSSQAERAFDADVIIEGPDLPAWLRELWIECNHATAPNPRVKLEQAERDALEYKNRTAMRRVPVVVWRKTGDKIIHITTRLTHLGESMRAFDGDRMRGGGLIVTCIWHDFLRELSRRIR